MEEKSNTPVLDQIGFLLSCFGMISVFLFLFNIFFSYNVFQKLGEVWTGFGENYTSGLPIYFGLMALCGAYLVKPDLIFADFTKPECEVSNKVKIWKGTNKFYRNGIRMEVNSLEEYHLIGYVFLIPGITGILSFLFNLFFGFDIFKNLGDEWTCFGTNNMSALPFYFGLMTIAGVYLVKSPKFILND